MENINDTIIGLPQDFLLKQMGFSPDEVESIKSPENFQQLKDIDNGVKPIYLDRYSNDFIKYVYFTVEDKKVWYSRVNSVDVDEREESTIIRFEFDYWSNSWNNTQVEVGQIVSINTKESYSVNKLDKTINAISKEWKITNKRVSSYKGDYATIVVELEAVKS